ncbi:TraB/GumN family protein [soil metagenome]
MSLRFVAAALLLWATATCPTAAPAACPPPPQAIDAAAGPAADHGLLWRLRRGGHDSYLFGSMHLGRPAWARPGPALRGAWAQTDVLAVELDAGAAQTQAALAAVPPLPRPLKPAIQQRLDAQLGAACLPPQALDGLHPLLQVSTLTLLAGRWDGLDSAFGQEVMLLGMARAEGRPVVALETGEQQMRALIPADEHELTRSIEQALTQLERGEVRGPMLRLALAWERGDFAALQSYERWCDCVQTAADRRALRALNDGRNPALAEAIMALHDGGARVFAAVGALHMTGPQALPVLLRKLGFELARIR